jgi:succinate dehydrogenase / fumarate reductase flavoprotein subunit
VEKKIEKLLSGGQEKTFRLHGELAKTMSTYAGIFRESTDIKKGIEDIISLKERYRNVGVSSSSLNMNYELMNAIELEHMFDVAYSITWGALLREESRGAHFRTDFPKRDDTRWLKHSIARPGGNGTPDISYKDVVITRFEPKERTY